MGAIHCSGTQTRLGASERIPVHHPVTNWPGRSGQFCFEREGVFLGMDEPLPYRIKRVVTLNGPRYYVFSSDGRMCGWSETMDGAQEIALQTFDESRTS